MPNNSKRNKTSRKAKGSVTKVAIMGYTGKAYSKISQSAEKHGMKFSDFTDHVNRIVQNRLPASFSKVRGGMELGGLALEVDVTSVSADTIMMLVSIAGEEAVA